MPTPPPPPTAPTPLHATHPFLAYLRTTAPSQSWLWKDSSFPTFLTPLIEAIESHTCYLSTDGSSRATSGGASWILSSSAWTAPHSPHLGEIIGSALCPGDGASAYRTELFGIYAGTLLLHHLCTFFHIPTGSFTVSCDNDGALSRPHTSKCKISTSSSDYDLLYELQRLHTLLPLTITTQQVTAHLDLTNTATYSFPERQNIRVDHLARAFTAAAAATHTPNPSTSFPPDHRWRLRTFAGVSTSSLRTDILSHISRRSTIHSWTRLNKFDGHEATVFDSLNWEAINNAISAQPLRSRIRISTMYHKCLPLGHHMHRCGFWTTPTCRCCGHTSETLPHLFSCQHSALQQTYAANTDAFTTALHQTETNPALVDPLLRLFSWSPTAPLDTSHPDTHIEHCLRLQHHIGWHLTRSGVFANEWATLQQSYYDTISTRRTSLHWQAHLTTSFWHANLAAYATRNTITHHKWTDGHTTTQHISINETITTAHASIDPSSLHPTNRSLFLQPLSDILQHSYSYKQSWLDDLSASHLEQAHVLRTFQPERANISAWLAMPTIA